MKKKTYIIIKHNEINSELINFLLINSNPIIIEIENEDNLFFIKQLLIKLEKINNPIILFLKYNENNLLYFQIKTACDLGEVVINKAINGIIIKNSINFKNNEDEKLAFNIFQSGGLRISRTEFISCPCCGRTQYDLLNITKKIKAKIGYNTNLKIAIMGCIINGPGEMADADFGFVGAGKNKVCLYKKQVCIKQNVNENEAVEILLNEIRKENNKI